MRKLLSLYFFLPTFAFAQVGIGTATPTHYLSLGGNSSRTVGLERHSTSGSSGSSLTILAGGAASTGSNLNGGNLILSSGITKGSGSSNIIFRTYPSGVPGSADNSAAERMRITSSGNVLIGIDAETTGSKLAVKGILGILSPNGDLMAISNQTNQYFNIQTYSSLPLYINQFGNDVIFSASDGKVAIGTTTPESSAKLEIATTTQGFLPPRMTSSQRQNISNPVAGLVVYQTDASSGLYYYNGSAWINVMGTTAYSSTEFTCGTSTVTFTYRGNSVTYGTVVGANGRCWLDRNLGATRVATSVSDASAYGDLFQWGRGDDDHQLPGSATTSTPSAASSPGHSDFIISSSSPYDWKSGRADWLWQGSTGVNNVCPSGWHIPTETEWLIERDASFPATTAASGYASVLKLPAAGIRLGTNGNIANPGVHSHYWTSTTTGSKAVALFVSAGDSNNYDARDRSFGMSVRCIKD